MKLKSSLVLIKKIPIEGSIHVHQVSGVIEINGDTFKRDIKVGKFKVDALNGYISENESVVALESHRKYLNQI